MTLEWLVEHFGYVAVLVGGFVEGETIVLLGGFAAHRGYLSLVGVIAAAGAGTFFGDQLYFLLGRTRGAALLARRSDWQARADRVFTLARRHQTLLILGFRFLYGVRTLTPFVLGMSGVGALRFTLLDTLSTALWAVGVGLAGYALGDALQRTLGSVRHYEHAIFALVALIGALLWGVRWRRASAQAGRTG